MNELMNELMNEYLHSQQQVQTKRKKYKNYIREGYKYSKK